MRLAWPEKIAAIAALLLAIVLFLFGSVLNGSAQSYDWMTAGGEIWFHFAKIFILPLWIVLRVVDWVAGGPKHRNRLIVFPPGR